MTINALDRIVAGALILFGLWLIQSGLQMGVMQGFVPGSGLFPVIFGVAIAALSVANLARAVLGAEKLKAGMSKTELLQTLAIILILIGTVASTQWLGLTLAAFITMLLVGTVLQQKRTWRFGLKLLVVSLTAAIACRFLFKVLLSVPVPVGILGF